MSSPIFKKGDKHNPCNYRPVSLTCIIIKCMEHILVSNIMQHLDSNKILYALPHGFRKKTHLTPSFFPSSRTCPATPHKLIWSSWISVKLSIRSHVYVYNISSNGTVSVEPYMPGLKKMCKGDRIELFLKGPNPPPILSSPVCPKVLFLAPYYV